MLNTLAKKELDNNQKVILTPLIDIYNNEDIKSRYNLWMNDPEVTKYNSHGLFPFNPKDNVQDIFNDKSIIIWAIVVEISPDTCGGQYFGKFEYTHIGNVTLQRIDLINRSAEFAIVIGETEYYNKGIASFACESICNHGFNKLGLNRIWSGTAATNKGMQKVFEKLCFEKEGTFKEAIYLDGKFIDVYEYGITKSQKKYYEFDFVYESQKDSRAKQHNSSSHVEIDPFKKIFNVKSTKSMNDIDLINQIEKIRSKNNTCWMNLVRIAFDKAPNEARQIMKSISNYDNEINDLSKKLTK